MRLPDGDWRSREGLAALAGALGRDAGGVRLVGGVVRDTLLGQRSADIDLATVHPPEESARRIRAAGFRAIPTGLAHGTVTAVLPSGPVEVTTLRRDVATDGRHATVAFTDDWRADAARRDFTINALSADPADGTVHDYFDGLADLAARRVRFIGDPLQRIAEDHLRVLRFFRFHARFGEPPPSPPDLDACAARANDLMALSRERIAQETLKLLALDRPTPTVSLMVARGIWRPVLPEIKADGVDRLADLDETETIVGVAPDAARRLAALLPRDPAVSDTVAARLRLSNALRKRLMLAATPIDPAMPPRALAHDIGVEGTIDRLLLGGGDPATILAGLEALRGWTPPRLPLTGGALIALGLPPGPIVAATLAAVERRWVAEGFPDAARVQAIAADRVAEAMRGAS